MRLPPPRVSVVIPTLDRPQLVARAVESALRQGIHDLEVIVVVDGPDQATLDSVRRIDDARVRVLALPEHVGVGGARNAGADAARAPWVAFLDDDDEWLPRKLDLQLDIARRSDHVHPIVSSCFVARMDEGDVVLPRRFPRASEPLSDYLFRQTGLLGGEGIILPSTIVTSADLVRQVRFRLRGAAHEMSDWLLRAARHPGVGIEFVPGRVPLAIWHGETDRARMSNGIDWRSTLAWACDNADLLTPQAHASFILIRTSLEAKHAHAWTACWRLLWAAIRRGRPTVAGVLAFASIWVVPRRIRFTAAALLSRWFPFSTDPRRTSCVP